MRRTGICLPLLDWDCCSPFLANLYWNSFPLAVDHISGMPPRSTALFNCHYATHHNPTCNLEAYLRITPRHVIVLTFVLATHLAFTSCSITKGKKIAEVAAD